MELNDRVVVITGGGSGIGEALAVAAKQAGARHVVVADLDGTQAARVAAAVGGTGVALDVRDESAVQRLVHDTEDAHGPIDLFVSNAGFVTTAGLEDSNDAIQRMWEVHCMAHIYAARAVLPSMIARGEGYLLNTASAAGLLTQIGDASYSVTKHGAVAFAEWLSATYRDRGVVVQALCPQGVRTSMIQGVGAAAPLLDNDRTLEPDDVADVLWQAFGDDRFLVLPHPEVAAYYAGRAGDTDRWLAQMNGLQVTLGVPRLGA